MGMFSSRQSKYRAKPTVVDGIRFASKREAARYESLKLLHHAGVIDEIERQVKYPLHSRFGEKICTYIADFRYRENGRLVVEDVKGMLTPMYRLKRKWMKAEYGIEIREV